MTTEAHAAGVGLVMLVTSLLHVVHDALGVLGPGASCPRIDGGHAFTTYTARLLADLSVTWQGVSGAAEELRHLVEQLIATLLNMVPALIGRFPSI